MFFRKIKKINFTRLFLFKSTQIGLGLLGISLIPVFFIILVTETFLNHEMTLNNIKPNDLFYSQYNIKYLIYYLCFSAVHILLSLIIIKQFKEIIKKNISIIHVKQLMKVNYASWIILGFLMFFLDYCKINISILSHSKLYQFLKFNRYFENLFLSFPSDIIGGNIEWFYLFSILPFSLILLGMGVLGWGCFSIAKEISNLDVLDLKIKELENSLSIFFKKFKSNIYLLSVILVTSTIATIFYFKLPIPIIKNDQILNSYIDLSISMGIFWGIMFSITLLFLCIGSYHYLNFHLKKTISKKRFEQSSEVQLFLLNNMETYSIVNNVKLIFTILSPSIASIITTTLIKFV